MSMIEDISSIHRGSHSGDSLPLLFSTDYVVMTKMILPDIMNAVMSATVVKGFGRGSKLLGIPTANMNMKEIGETVCSLNTGIYHGFACLRNQIYRTVVSIGWNPYFDNKEKTVEPHLLHDFGDDDFYGETLHLRICGYIRPEMNFKSLDDLIQAIHGDISYASDILSRPEYLLIESELRKDTSQLSSIS